MNTSRVASLFAAAALRAAAVADGSRHTGTSSGAPIQAAPSSGVRSSVGIQTSVYNDSEALMRSAGDN